MNLNPIRAALGTNVKLKDVRAKFGEPAANFVWKHCPKVGRGVYDLGMGSEESPAASNVDQLSEGETAAMIQERFDVLELMGHGVVSGNIRSMICSGAGGVGKTYTLEKILGAANAAGSIDTLESIKGSISAIGLYMKLYENNRKGQVLILDDIDSVFNDEEAMNLLKGALDTSDRRVISWIKDSRFLEDKGIPTTFEYQGQIVFLTNYDIDAIVARGGKLAPHMAALLTRVTYLDLCIHTPRQVLIRINQVLNQTDMAKKLNLRDSQVVEIVDFISSNIDRLRSISLRTVIQIAGYMNATADWKRLARATMIKGL